MKIIAQILLLLFLVWAIGPELLIIGGVIWVLAALAKD